jgi:hypothetical protein
MDLVVTVALALLVLGLVAYVIGRATQRSNQRMRGGSEDQRRADDGGSGPYSDYGSPMG